MIFQKKNRIKPLYKQFLKFRENVQNRKKLWNFKKKKWELFKKFDQKKFKKYKPKDQTQYIVSRYPSRWCSYIRRYKNMLIINKKLKLSYGGLLKKFIKKQIKKILNKNYKNITLRFLRSFEHRLDVILYKSHFALSIRAARQLILHKKIFVNYKLIKVGSYLLKAGDLITINPKSFNYIKLNITKSSIWPLPPKHLSVNYKTLQIVFEGFMNVNLSLNFLYHLHLEKILTSYYQK